MAALVAAVLVVAAEAATSCVGNRHQVPLTLASEDQEATMNTTDEHKAAAQRLLNIGRKVDRLISLYFTNSPVTLILVGWRRQR